MPIIFSMLFIEVLANASSQERQRAKERGREMSAPNCPHFDPSTSRVRSCNAPLCPLNPQNLAHAAWFPDEETCHKADLRTAPWIVGSVGLPRPPARISIAAVSLSPCYRRTFESRRLSEGLILTQGHQTPQRCRRGLRRIRR